MYAEEEELFSSSLYPASTSRPKTAPSRRPKTPGSMIVNAASASSPIIRPMTAPSSHTSRNLNDALEFSQSITSMPLSRTHKAEPFVDYSLQLLSKGEIAAQIKGKSLTVARELYKLRYQLPKLVSSSK